MKATKYFALILILVCLATSAYADDPKPLPFVEGSWTLVLLPDTQCYADTYHDIFMSQTRWIADHATERNIAFVLSEGDVTNHDVPCEWEVAKAAFGLLDGKVPYALQLGNHDYPPEPLCERATLANVYFPPELVQKSPAYGGAYQRNKLDNAYYLFTAGGQDWIVLSLEFAPRDEVIRWANIVLEKYCNRSAMICTHAYLMADGKRFDHLGGGRKMVSDMDGLNDGKQMWQKMVSKHANVMFVFCGHVLSNGTAPLVSTGDAGNTVYQILADYQGFQNGGDGYLRLMEFLPDGKSVQVKTYSTTRNDYITDAGNQYVLSW